MSITVWGIVHIIGFFLCLYEVLVFRRRAGFSQYVYLVFFAVSVLHILGFLWHSIDDNFLADALLIFDIFSMICLAGTFVFFYLTIDCQSHKVLKPDADGDISKLDMDSVENAENCYVFKYENLYIIFPRYRKIKYVFQKCPSMKEENLTFFSTATFCKKLSFAYYILSALFGKVPPRFHYVSVVGYHTQGGVAYEGSDCGEDSTSAFTFYDGEANFVLENPGDAIKLAAEKGGDGFESMMAIWDGKSLGILEEKSRCYRVLAELNGRVCIIENSILMSYDDFIQSVLDTGAQKALYLDMGAKSSYSQYRNNQNRVINLFSRFGIYFSGWIAFYK